MRDATGVIIGLTAGTPGKRRAGLGLSVSGKASTDGPHEKPMKEAPVRSRKIERLDLEEGVGCRNEYAGVDVGDEDVTELKNILPNADVEITGSLEYASFPWSDDPETLWD